MDGSFQTAFVRQVAEAVEIKRRKNEEEVILLNSNVEYNRCTLPDIYEITNDEELEKEKMEDLKLMKEIRDREKRRIEAENGKRKNENDKEENKTKTESRKKMRIEMEENDKIEVLGEENTTQTNKSEPKTDNIKVKGNEKDREQKELEKETEKVKETNQEKERETEEEGRQGRKEAPWGTHKTHPATCNDNFPATRNITQIKHTKPKNQEKLTRFFERLKDKNITPNTKTKAKI